MDAFNLFLDSQKILDRTLLQIDSELVAAADIHEALYSLAAFKHDLETLPNTFAELVAEKAKADARRARREDEAKKAKHPMAMIETTLRKLGESLVYNASLAESAEADPSALAQTFGAALPGTRRERVEQIKREIAEAEVKLAELKPAHKKAVSLYKGEVTKSKNLAAKLAETGLRIDQNRKKLSDMAKLAKKTADHLKNRQAHRVRKAKKAQADTSTIPGFENADGSSIVFENVRLEPLPKSGPTDEELRRKAEKFFGQSVTDEDLAALRDDLVRLDV